MMRWSTTPIQCARGEQYATVSAGRIQLRPALTSVKNDNKAGTRKLSLMRDTLSARPV